jgi:transcriptional regulator with XRE-family HTH domain
VSAAEVRAFGREVFRRRSDLGMTQEELGGRAKMSAIFIGRVERGKMRRGLSLGMAFRIAKGLDGRSLTCSAGRANSAPWGSRRGAWSRRSRASSAGSS